MLIALLLLFPVYFILLWAYWALLPKLESGRFIMADYIVILVLFSLALLFIKLVFSKDWSEVGAIWPHVLAATGGYLILACGLLVSVLVRRSHNTA